MDRKGSAFEHIGSEFEEGGIVYATIAQDGFDPQVGGHLWNAVPRGAWVDGQTTVEDIYEKIADIDSHALIGGVGEVFPLGTLQVTQS